MREKIVEQILVTGIRKLGGIAFKFVSPGNDGVPDRMVTMPDGKVCFVELKRTTGKLSGLQKTQIGRLEKLDQYVAVLYGVDEVRQFLHELETGDAWHEMQEGQWL